MTEEQSKKIRFEATGNLSDFMKKVSKDGESMYQTFAKQASEQTKSEKERFKIIRDNVNALKEQLRIEEKISKEKLRTAEALRRDATGYKETKFAEEQYKSAQAEVERIERIKRAARYAGTLNVDNKKNDPRDPTAQSVFSGVVMAGLLRDLGQLIRQTATARSELDLLPGAGGLFGAIVGGAAGLGMSPATTQIGKSTGEFFGQAYARSLNERERLESATNRVLGRTGISSQAGDMAAFGLDRAAGAQLEESIVDAIAKGTTTQQVRNVAALAKAFTIDSGTITQFLGTGRMGSKANEGQIAGLMAQGIDRSHLGLATQNITQMLQLMGQSSLNPRSADAIQRITELNNIGGVFSVSDPRSMALNAQYQSNLVNPQSAFAQALSYKVLREQNPELGIVDLIKKRQEGGAVYERALMEQFAGMTGSKDFATLAYSQNFGTGGKFIAADEARLAGRGKIAAGGMQQATMGEFSSQYGIGTKELYAEATKMTTDLQRNTASVTNAFIVNFSNGIETLANLFTERMKDAIEAAVRDRIAIKNDSSLIDNQIDIAVHLAKVAGKTTNKSGK